MANDQVSRDVDPGWDLHDQVEQCLQDGSCSETWPEIWQRFVGPYIKAREAARDRQLGAYCKQARQAGIEAACSQTVAPGLDAYQLAELNASIVPGTSLRFITCHRDHTVGNVFNYGMWRCGKCRWYPGEEQGPPSPKCGNCGNNNYTDDPKEATALILLKSERGLLHFEIVRSNLPALWAVERERDTLKATLLAPPAVSTPRCPVCPGCGSPKLTYLSTELKVICEGCFGRFHVWKLQDFAQFFQPESQPSPAGPERDPGECSYCVYCSTPIKERPLGKERAWFDERGRFICHTAKDGKSLIGHTPKEPAQPSPEGERR